MKTAADYPITFKYGATTPPYSPSHPHSGDDRAMPVGTPVLVNGTLIGYSGRTGKVTGPHTHTQKKMKNIVNPYGGGFSVPQPTTVTETGFNNEIGNYVRYKDANGVQWSIFHLSSISVKVGNKLGGTMDEITRLLGHIKTLEAQVKQDKREYKALLNSAQAIADVLGIVHDADHVDQKAVLNAVKALKAGGDVVILKPGKYAVI